MFKRYDSISNTLEYSPKSDPVPFGAGNYAPRRSYKTPHEVVTTVDTFSDVSTARTER
jgi:hypothetical protein